MKLITVWFFSFLLCGFIGFNSAADRHKIGRAFIWGFEGGCALTFVFALIASACGDEESHAVVKEIANTPRCYHSNYYHNDTIVVVDNSSTEISSTEISSTEISSTEIVSSPANYELPSVEVSNNSVTSDTDYASSMFDILSSFGDE